MEIRDSCGVVTVHHSELQTVRILFWSRMALVENLNLYGGGFKEELKMVDQQGGCLLLLLPENKAHVIAAPPGLKPPNVASIFWAEGPLCPEPCLAKQLLL